MGEPRLWQKYADEHGRDIPLICKDKHIILATPRLSCKPLIYPPKPTVTANAKVGGSSFSDVNQTARTGVDPEQPTLIADHVTTKAAKDTVGKFYPNATMGTAHAEIGTIQQAFNAGKTQGKTMKMIVEGKRVCTYCRSDLRNAADKAGLKSLEIYEQVTGKTLVWTRLDNGTMGKLKEVLPMDK